ncbi:hypothetical protein DSECCO2_208790 [anaerobic digester metagenome]
MVNDSEFCIRYMDMPCTVRAFVVEDNGFYNIFVNSRLNFEQNMKSIRHELCHIKNGDFCACKGIDFIEKIRHGIK